MYIIKRLNTMRLAMEGNKNCIESINRFNEENDRNFIENNKQ